MRILFFIFILCLPCFASVEDAVNAARSQVGKTLIYDSSYVKLDYPMGDVPLIRGVCTDVVVRALRASGADLQQLIHEDMKANFSKYPNNWGLTKPDQNIDHRRVPNIARYYERQGKSLPLPVTPSQIKIGDLITWILPNNRPHIGIVTSVKDNKVLLVHNIGLGAQEQAVLNKWKITGHYRPDF